MNRAVGEVELVSELGHLHNSRTPPKVRHYTKYKDLEVRLARV